MSRKTNRAFEAARTAIDRLCEPSAMTKAEAVDYLEQIVDHCRASIEALRDEMKEDA